MVLDDVLRNTTSRAVPLTLSDCQDPPISGTASRNSPAWLPRSKSMRISLRTKNTETISAWKDGRSGRIRTCDPCVPNAVLYRAEPHSD